MKKNLLLIIVLYFVSISVIAQDLVPNRSFENWVNGNYYYPQFYPFNSNNEVFFLYQLPFNETRTTDAYHGTYAVQLTTVASERDTSVGYVVNSPYTDGNIDTWHGGIPISGIPTGIRGYYKYNVVSGDAGFIVVTFSKSGTNIGSYMYLLEGNHAAYQPFNFTFAPALAVAPDSIVFGAASSDLFNGRQKAGSTLLIDSVKLTGVVTQPLLMNNDFELWQNVAVEKPAIWYAEREGTKKTTDAYLGSYAAEMTTFSGNDGGVIVARGGQISTGYYSQSCNCLEGGYPYTLKKDALVFYYKYAPAPGSDDQAEVSLVFRKNGVNIWQSGAMLGAAADYTRYEFPFDQPADPDSVVIFFQSSTWNNKALSYVGSVLKIDDVHFKSEETPTAIRKISKTDKISVYPNPTTGKLSVEIPEFNTDSTQPGIEIFNVIGNPVHKSTALSQKTEIDLSGLPDGVYILKVYNGKTIHTSKVLKR